jgi:hypothetical protein
VPCACTGAQPGAGPGPCPLSPCAPVCPLPWCGGGVLESLPRRPGTCEGSTQDGWVGKHTNHFRTSLPVVPIPCCTLLPLLFQSPVVVPSCLSHRCCRVPVPAELQALPTEQGVCAQVQVRAPGYKVAQASCVYWGCNMAGNGWRCTHLHCKELWQTPAGHPVFPLPLAPGSTLTLSW